MADHRTKIYSRFPAAFSRHVDLTEQYRTEQEAVGATELSVLTFPQEESAARPRATTTCCLNGSGRELARQTITHPTRHSSEQLKPLIRTAQAGSLYGKPSHIQHATLAAADEAEGTCSDIGAADDFSFHFELDRSLRVCERLAMTPSAKVLLRRSETPRKWDASIDRA